jgi:hypothetical protein
MPCARRRSHRRAAARSRFRPPRRPTQPGTTPAILLAAVHHRAGVRPLRCTPPMGPTSHVVPPLHAGACGARGSPTNDMHTRRRLSWPFHRPTRRRAAPAICLNRAGRMPRTCGPTSEHAPCRAHGRNGGMRAAGTRQTQRSGSGYSLVSAVTRRVGGLLAARRPASSGPPRADRSADVLAVAAPGHAMSALLDALAAPFLPAPPRHRATPRMLARPHPDRSRVRQIVERVGLGGAQPPLLLHGGRTMGWPWSPRRTRLNASGTTYGRPVCSILGPDSRAPSRLAAPARRRRRCARSTSVFARRAPDRRAPLARRRAHLRDSR